MKEILGHIDCPCCGEPATVTPDKNGNPFVFCTDRNCATQVFTRREHQKSKLLARMRPVTVTAPEAQLSPAPKRKPDPEEANRIMQIEDAKQKPRRSAFEDALAVLGVK